MQSWSPACVSTLGGESRVQLPTVSSSWKWGNDTRNHLPVTVDFSFISSSMDLIIIEVEGRLFVDFRSIIANEMNMLILYQTKSLGERTRHRGRTRRW